MEGPTAAQIRNLLPRGKRSKPSVLLHVGLQARMEERMAGEAVRDDLQEAGFNAGIILANVEKLQKLVSGLAWEPATEGWAAYDTCTHVGRDRETKAGFLRHAMSRHRPERVLDLGANDAYFSEIASDGGAHAIAVDSDESILERVYRQSKGKSMSLALSELANPSPAQGWSGVERPSLFARADADLVIAYGLIHHLIYSASIPPALVVEWLRGFDCPVVVEFVAPDDEMVRTLSSNKHEEELHPGRDEAAFLKLLAASFDVTSEKKLGSGSRVLFQLAPI
jgi:hypothetical protein